MAGLFKSKGGGNKPKPTPQSPQAPVQTNNNGAIAGASQNYGSSNLLSGQSAIQRGTFLGS